MLCAVPCCSVLVKPYELCYAEQCCVMLCSAELRPQPPLLHPEYNALAGISRALTLPHHVMSLNVHCL